MIDARIDGTVTSTHCHPSLRGWRVAICQPVDETGRDAGDPVLALDPLLAGLHQRVCITSDGESARSLVHDARSPARFFVVGLIDTPFAKNRPQS
jgi:microcompartment protein CcmK/EutM